jgi:hypothetical protein
MRPCRVVHVNNKGFLLLFMHVLVHLRSIFLRTPLGIQIPVLLTDDGGRT